MTALPRLGCLPPHPSTHPVHAVRLALYLDGELPPPPPVFEPSPQAIFKAFGNDDGVSDCGPVSVASFFIASWPVGSANITAADVLALYTSVTGYDPADPSTDNGAILSDVLTACHNSAFGGLGGHVLTAFAALDKDDVTKIEQAIATPGLGVVVGLRMPREAQGTGSWDTPSVLTGDYAPGSWGGHAVAVVGYDVMDETFTVVSWGEEFVMDRGFWQAYGVEAWALVDGEAPGVDVARLRADLARLAGGGA